jgi:predicted transglutaminase-like cysteine proteinase
MAEMKFTRVFSCALIGLAATLVATTCDAGILGPSPMRLGASAAAPDGFLAWCARSPVDCAGDPAVSQQVASAAQEQLRLQWERRIQGAAQVSHPAALTDEIPDLRPTPRFSFARLFAREPRREPAEGTTKAWPRAEMTKALWASLTGVNAFVNAHVRKVSDREQYGLDDWWASPLSEGPVAAGDCEDFVLEKRKELIAAGVAPETLTIAMVETRQGELHAVLVAATDKGDYVLDSLNPDVRPWDRVDYRWISRQSPGDRLAWFEVR